MANIKDLKKKIKSTKGTLKITTAMKLVSAAKLNRAQHAILNSRPYADELDATIRTISALIENYSHSYLGSNSGSTLDQKALLVISSDKGLCGAYNSQLAKEVKAFLARTGGQFKVFFIGKKCMELLRKEVNFAKHFKFNKGEANYSEIKNVAEELGDLFSSGEFSSVYVAYNNFKSAISFKPTVKQLLPLTVTPEEKEKIKDAFPFDFKYDMRPKEILDSLIPQSYVTSFYTCYLDAIASEHGSRMSAMDSASGNCKEMIRTTTLRMNKLRQAAITTELIEVISGAESLNQ